jgi:hypothetical protein
VLALLALGASSAGAVSFGGGIDYPLPDPNSPTPGYGGVAVGDLNADGKPEIIVPRANAGKVWVFPNNGDGTFATAASTPSCDAAHTVYGQASGPVVVLQCNGGQFELLPGDGHGGFGPPTDSQVFAAPRGAMAIGALDGQPDLVFDIGNVAGQNICLLELANFTGTPPCGSGDFKELTNQFVLARTNVTETPLVVNLADANNFGFTGYSTAWNAYTQRGASADNGAVVAAGDLNGDAIDDVLVVNYGASTTPGTIYSMLARAGTGGFENTDHGVLAGTAIPDPSYAELTDFDADGKRDLIVAGTDNAGTGGNPEFAVMPGNGDGTFAAPQLFSTGFSPDSTAWWLGVSDLNGDGRPDVVIANGDEQKVRVFLNSTSGAPSVTPGGGGGPGGPGGAPGGGGSGPGPGGAITRVTLSKVHLTSSTFRIGHLPTRFTRSAPTGTTLSFTVDQAARASFTFTALSPGKRSGRRCVAPKPKLRHARACTRRVRAGSLAFNATAGAHKLFFDGRLSSRKTLRPGKYELAVTATAAGLTSPPAKLVLKLLPALKRR